VVKAPTAMNVSSVVAVAEVRTYVSENLGTPPDVDLKIITRRAADGAITLEFFI
jgi:hypothetical protein